MKTYKEIMLVDNSNKDKELEWLALRKTGLTGTDIGAIVGLNKKKSALAVWLDKTNAEVVVQEDKEIFRMGRDLEPYVAKRFEEVMGKKTKEYKWMVSSLEYPFMMANIDYLIDGENAALECKVSKFEDIWEDGLPPSYEMQCQHYMYVMGFDKMYLAVYIIGEDFRVYEINRDEETMKMLVELEVKFWEENVLGLKMPEPDGSEAYNRELNGMYGSTVDTTIKLTKEMIELLNARESLKLEIEQKEQEIRLAEEKIKVAMGESEFAKGNFGNKSYSVSWKIDKKGSRRFLVNIKKGDE